MTEVVSAPTGVEQAQYFDDIGNAIGWDKYLDFEADEAQRYLKELPKGEKTYVRPPASIMALIAAQGIPEMSDFDIRFGTRYVHYDGILEGTLAAMQQSGLLQQTRRVEQEIPEKYRLVGRPDIRVETYYMLAERAYELLPVLAQITDAKQAAINKASRRLGSTVSRRRASV